MALVGTWEYKRNAVSLSMILSIAFGVVLKKAHKDAHSMPWRALTAKHRFRESPYCEVNDADWQNTEMPDHPTARPARKRPSAPPAMLALFEPEVNSRIDAKIPPIESEISFIKGFVKPSITEKKTINPQTVITAFVLSRTEVKKLISAFFNGTVFSVREILL